MRDYLSSGCRWLRAGWFLAFVLLALPNCGLHTQGIPCDPDQQKCEVFEPGDDPTTDAVMCDIPAPPNPDVDICATPEEAADTANVSLTEAATALAISKHSSFALDFSEGAKKDCKGLPKKVRFLGGGQFPDGLRVCINCGAQIPTKYDTPNQVCVYKCIDLINFGNGPIPAEGIVAYCGVNAHTATNYDKNVCYPGACTEGGNDNDNFVDPRRTPELVKWIDPHGTDDGGGTNNLTRNLATSTPPAFDAGAASSQTILSGDGWVEFRATEIDLSHVVGVRHSCGDPVNNCPDMLPGLDDIGFAISLNGDGQVYVIESGPPLTVSAPFGTYDANERFRVKFVDNHDGKTATISYARVVGACPDGSQCTEEPFGTMATAAYPLRVDASFREQNATVSNVTLVRIQ